MSQAPINWESFFAKNLRTERSRLGITQQDLASELGLKSGATVTQWEKSTSFPNLETFVRVCNFFQKLPTQMLYEDLTGTSPPKKGKDEDTELVVEGGHKQPAAANREEPPPKAEKGELQAMRRQVLEVLNKIEEMESAQ